MRWFVARAFALCVVMSALIGGTVLYRRTHAEPNPLHAYGLDICYDKPCFMGIIPGVTSWEEAQSLVMNYPHRAWNGQDLLVLVNNIAFVIFQDAGYSRVRDITSYEFFSKYTERHLLSLGNALVQ